MSAGVRSPIPEAVVRGRVVAIGRRLPPTHAIVAADALRTGGVGGEITLNSDGTLNAAAIVAAATGAVR